MSACTHKRRRQTGFSLVELMISLALSAVLTVGIIQLFSANSDSYNLLQGQSRMQESARFAMSFIGRAVRVAGYRGCFSDILALNMTMDSNNMPYEYDVRKAIQGFNAAGGANWSPSINILPTTTGGSDTNVYGQVASKVGNGIDTSQIVQGTDILTTRNMSTDEARLTQSMPTSTEDIVVATPANGFTFGVDHFAMIEDCEKATVFRVTDMQADTPTAGQTTIGHDISDTDAYRNTVTKLAIVNTFQDDAGVAGIESYTFFIAPGQGYNNAGDKPLSLWRKSGLDAPVELVEGVEDMQILYGVDTDEDNTPNNYETANQVVDWSKVKTVRVSLVVNSVDDVGGTTTPTHGCTIQDCIDGESYDGLIRRTFTQTFEIRNK